jgi:glutathione S-transferase
MKLYVFPPSGRSIGIIALKNYLALDCDLVPIDLERGDQRTPEYAALNVNRKVPTLDDDGVLLWESNAILFYLASKRPESGVWPAHLRGQSDVLRWLFWESAHWDAESVGMITYEKNSKAVLGLGPPDPAFIARGEQNFNRFAAVLNDSLERRTWLVGDQLTIADFSIGGLLPTAERMALPLTRFPEVRRWYEGLASMTAWRDAVAARDAAMVSWLSERAAAQR